MKPNKKLEMIDNIITEMEEVDCCQISNLSQWMKISHIQDIPVPTLLMKDKKGLKTVPATVKDVETNQGHLSLTLEELYTKRETLIVDPMTDCDTPFLENLLQAVRKFINVVKESGLLENNGL